jgi:addiction module RelE/StbE family toxin
MKVIWSPSALREVIRIYDYLTDFNPKAAAEVFTALVEAGNNLRDFPHRGRPVRNSDKREIVTSYPYIIRYRVNRDGIRILRVRHTARRPTNP